ncbi:hypothetical protein B0T14DRAFT_606028 [Immersiella caudata]|uniref:DUF6923 domain-containing protein n=1 Tax=Immersiella caudata TaxID=314043 RepID=A0AA39WDS0_9PEZI|nr:hypothetical protein B0T14DRAFT_606028 [Immersiella caudata]
MVAITWKAALAALLVAASSAPGTLARCVHKPSSVSASASYTSSSAISWSSASTASSASSVQPSSAASSASSASSAASSAPISSSIASSAASSPAVSSSALVSSSAVVSSSVVSSSAVPSSVVSSSVISSAAPLPTFPCISDVYLIESNRLKDVSINLNTRVPVLVAEFQGGGIDAIAYNELDGYIYGVQRDATVASIFYVLRLGSNGGAETIYTFNGWVGGSINMGAIDADGVFWISDSGRSVAALDVSGSAATLLDTSVPLLVGFLPFDWAYVPLAGDEYLYTVARREPRAPSDNSVFSLRFSKTAKTWEQMKEYDFGTQFEPHPVYAFNSVNGLYSTDPDSQYNIFFDLDYNQDGNPALGAWAIWGGYGPLIPNDGTTCPSATPQVPFTTF